MLLGVEIGALVLLLGAQVIAEYERIGHEPIEAADQLRTEDPPSNEVPRPRLAGGARGPAR